MRACCRPTIRFRQSEPVRGNGLMTVFDLDMNATRADRAYRKHSETAWPFAMTAAELCVVVPTYNERDNIPELIERVTAAMRGVEWEMIIVDDDSPDGTGQLARA